MKAVIFDKDGILVDSEILYDKWLQEYMAEHDIPLPFEVRSGIIGSSSKQNKEIFAQYLAEYGGAKLWDDFLASANVDLDYGNIVFPGVKELITWLKSENIPIGLASAAGLSGIYAEIEQMGLSDAFDMIMSGEQVKVSKPDPEIYLKSCEKLGVSPSECIAVEDSKHGIDAAKNAGLTVIARRETRLPLDQSRADYIVEDMFAVKDKIAELFRM